mmetsp:Transcript_54714/g.163550  ORF Transcript_54714/g.163550 Transcript_54714/m.163550 type:complete len:604 (-) Transcript_54714:311-2122(-)
MISPLQPYCPVRRAAPILVLVIFILVNVPESHVRRIAVEEPVRDGTRQGRAGAHDGRRRAASHRAPGSSAELQRSQILLVLVNGLGRYMNRGEGLPSPDADGGVLRGHGGGRGRRRRGRNDVVMKRGGDAGGDRRGVRDDAPLSTAGPRGHARHLPFATVDLGLEAEELELHGDHVGRLLLDGGYDSLQVPPALLTDLGHRPVHVHLQIRHGPQHRRHCRRLGAPRVDRGGGGGRRRRSGGAIAPPALGRQQRRSSGRASRGGGGGPPPPRVLQLRPVAPPPGGAGGGRHPLGRPRRRRRRHHRHGLLGLRLGLLRFGLGGAPRRQRRGTPAAARVLLLIRRRADVPRLGHIPGRRDGGEDLIPHVHEGDALDSSLRLVLGVPPDLFFPSVVLAGGALDDLHLDCRPRRTGGTRLPSGRPARALLASPLRGRLRRQVVRLLLLDERRGRVLGRVLVVNDRVDARRGGHPSPPPVGRHALLGAGRRGRGRIVDPDGHGEGRDARHDGRGVGVRLQELDLVVRSPFQEFGLVVVRSRRRRRFASLRSRPRPRPRSPLLASAGQLPPEVLLLGPYDDARHVLLLLLGFPRGSVLASGPDVARVGAE